jgi:hypothetical protein
LSRCKEVFPSWLAAAKPPKRERDWRQELLGMEEIIATEGEVKWVNKAAVSANQAITASQNITVKHCLNLRRMPLSLPLLDNVQPSPPPSLRIME